MIVDLDKTENQDVVADEMEDDEDIEPIWIKMDNSFGKNLSKL